MKQSASDLPSAQTAQLHALIVRFSAVSAWVVALALTVVATATGDQVPLLQAVAAGTGGLVFTLQLLASRANALVTMGFGIILVMITFPIITGTEIALAASMAIVAMAIVASLFIPRHPMLFLGVGSVFMMSVPLLWADNIDAGLTAGIIMAVSFLVGAAAFILIRRKTLEADQKFRWVFERAPVGLVEQDWNEALAFIEELGPRDDTDLHQMLTTRPELLPRILGSVRVVRANHAVTEILKVSLDQFLGYMPPERVEQTNRDVWIRQVVGMWSGRPFDVVEYEATDYQGNPGLWIEVRTISVGAPKAGHVVLAVTDVTQSRQKSRDLADLVREKDEFIATISHELRTPLTAVVGLANEVLAGKDLSDAEKGELLELVVSQANEISHLVEDLLVGARADIGMVSINREPLDLVAEATTVLSVLEDRIPVEVAGPYPFAFADPVRVRQIVRNLVVNAQRYGGLSKRLMIAPGDGSDGVVLEVRDNGPALGGDDRQRIFQPYTRAHDRPGMTVSVGLGLSVSRRLAELMNGRLTYDHDGIESIFRLELPEAPAVRLEPRARQWSFSLR